MMRLAFLLFFTVSFGFTPFNGLSQNAKVNLKTDKTLTVDEVFDLIEEQTSYRFVYPSSLIKDLPKVGVKRGTITVKDLLNNSFLDIPVDYEFRNKKNIVLTKTVKNTTDNNKEEQQQTITGTVTDEDGVPLPGVNITVEGTTRGTQTDFDGNYTIEAERGEILHFSFVGYVELVEIIDDEVTINIQMKESENALDEVVVIGYGAQKKSSVTGSISSVKGDQLSRSGGENGIQQALQGKVAGVNITPTSGQPGGDINMSVRGVATFGSGNPLFVIDGLPILNSEGSVNFNPIASLSADNIESVEILKDASASAIYGARAANGVVIITTKKGRVGKPRIDFKSSFSFSQIPKLLPLLNSAEYIDYASEAYKNAGQSLPVSFEEPLLSQNIETNTDWQREGFKNSFNKSYFVGLSGGSENATYSLSGSILDQKGTLPNSGFKNYLLNISNEFKIGQSKRLKIGETVHLSRSEWTGTFDQSSFDMRQLLQQSPTVPVYKDDADGGFDGPRLEYSPVGRQNSIGVLSLRDNHKRDNRILGNLFADYEVFPWLSNRFNVGVDIVSGRDFDFMPTFDMGDRVSDLAHLTEERYSNDSYLIENITTVKHTFNNIHEFSALIGFTQQNFWSSRTGVEVRDFQSNSLRSVGAAFDKRDISGLETGWALRSQMARLNYSFKDKINLMAVVRRDGSSRFGNKKRYGIFPSISGSWILSKESFLESVRELSNFTIRASYGKVGSQDINEFAQYSVIQPDINYIFGENQDLTPGATYTNMGNPELKWEVTTQTNIGLDIGLFNQKLSFILDYYIKDTDDVLVQLPIPTTSGIRRDNGPFVNAGSVRNQGLELSVSYENSFKNDFTYNLTANISTNKNKVTALNNGQPIIAEMASGKQAARTITREGDGLGRFYGYVMEGVFEDQSDVDSHAFQEGAAPGDVKFKDLDGNGVIDSDDQTVIGDPYPDIIYGINGNLKYRNLDFSLTLNGKQGQDLYNLIWSDLNEGEGDNNATRDQLQRWTPNNRITDVPRAIAGNPAQNTRTSSRFVQDASYLRIQNVQIGYVLPNLFSSEKNMNVRIFFSVNNLYTFTKYKGYNPDIGRVTSGNRSSLTKGIDFGMYPIPRTFKLGVELNL